MDWYVIQAYSGYEQKVKAALEERISLNNLSTSNKSHTFGISLSVNLAVSFLYYFF